MITNLKDLKFINLKISIAFISKFSHPIKLVAKHYQLRSNPIRLLQFVISIITILKRLTEKTSGLLSFVSNADKAKILIGEKQASKKQA